MGWLSIQFNGTRNATIDEGISLETWNPLVHPENGSRQHKLQPFMIAKYFSLVVTIISLSVAQPRHAAAQFGGFFGGPKIETIDTQTINQLVRQRQSAVDKAKEVDKKPANATFVLVDVRSDSETKVSVIPGAITKAQFENDRGKYKDRLVIPYCTVGVRSGAYAKKLAGKGVKVKNYQGSILKWVDAGLPLVTLDGKPTRRVHTYSDRYRIPPEYEQVTK